MSKRDILEHPDLRRVWNLMETESPPVEWDALTALRSTAQPRARTRPGAGLWLAATVFALVLAVGGVALITGEPDDPVPGGPLANLDWDLMVTFPAPSDPEAVTDQIEAIDGVRSVDYYPNAAAFDEPAPPETPSVVEEDPVETTIVGPETGSTGTDTRPTFEITTTAAALVLLEDPDLAESVAHTLKQDLDVYEVRYSADLAVLMTERYFEWVSEGATIIGEDPLILQARPGPKPEFDTDSLGTEVTLLPATSADEIPVTFWYMSTTPLSVEEDWNRSPDRPVLHVGHLAEVNYRLLLYGSPTGRRCESSGLYGACYDLNQYRYGISGYSYMEGMVGEVEVEVPEGTSVVTISVDGGPVLWQRPVAGWAIFPTELGDFPEFEVVAYDVAGQVIGRWDQEG